MADYLGEYLLKDKHVIDKVLRAFASDDSIGVYYPTSFWMMPDWVNHWLKNKGAAARFVNEWGINTHGEFIAYPVGGMFWARPKALMQLFAKNYQYDDFPEEPLANDDTELHALERCIGLLAEENGFKQLFYHPPTGEFSFDKTFVFSNYLCDGVALQNKLENFDNLSFDVFDTLVRREFFVPDYAKLLLGKRLTEQGIVADGNDFVRLRNQAELAIRQKKQFAGDVTLAETYDELARHFSWSLDEAKYFADLEFEFDLSMIQAKDELVDLCNKAIVSKKNVWIISDTYYSNAQIELMLRKVGVASGYKLYVSSECSLRKDNGTMWAYLQPKIQKTLGSFVHIGDNAVADAQIPGDYGIQNLHILNPLDKWQAAGLMNPFSGDNGLDEKEILKWGPLISAFGRYPFLGE